MSIRMSTIKLNTDCICLGHQASNARSLQENSQLEGTIVAKKIIIGNNYKYSLWEQFPVLL